MAFRENIGSLERFYVSRQRPEGHFVKTPSCCNHGLSLGFLGAVLLAILTSLMTLESFSAFAQHQVINSTKDSTNALNLRWCKTFPLGFWIWLFWDPLDLLQCSMPFCSLIRHLWESRLPRLILPDSNKPKRAVACGLWTWTAGSAEQSMTPAC
jgi:hypothetical protein